MQLFIVGEAVEEHEQAWLFAGVFESEEMAVKACWSEKYFIAPATLNELMSPVCIDWEGGYYPHLEESKIV